MAITYEQIEPYLKAVLDEFEWQEFINTGMKHLNGGYAHAEYASMDEDGEWVYITLKWGVNDGGTKNEHIEDYKISVAHLISAELTIREKAEWVLEEN